MEQPRPHDVLLKQIKARLPELETLYQNVNGHWGIEDSVYRFYHGSFKVFNRFQPMTQEIVKILNEINDATLAELPYIEKRPLNDFFLDVIKAGTGKTFKLAYNKRWLKETRPLCEAFFHANHVLQMVIKYGKELDKGPQMLPSGWATVLYIFNMR